MNISRLVIHLDGVFLNKLVKLLKQFYQIGYQAQSLYMTGEKRSQLRPEVQQLLKLQLSKIQVQFFFENLSELISVFTKNYFSRIFSLLVSDQLRFEFLLQEIKVERAALNKELLKYLIEHYFSYSGLQLFESISNKEIIKNPAKMLEQIIQILYRLLSSDFAAQISAKHLKKLLCYFF